jgi:hypothetical protein
LSNAATISRVNVFSPPTETPTGITEEILVVASKKAPTKGNKVTFCEYAHAKKAKSVGDTDNDEVINSVSLGISSLSMVHHTQDPPPIIPNANLPPVILPDGASMVMIDPDLVPGDAPDPELDSEESQPMDSADPEETGTFSFEVPEFSC